MISRSRKLLTNDQLSPMILNDNILHGKRVLPWFCYWAVERSLAKVSKTPCTENQEVSLQTTYIYVTELSQ